MRELSTSADQPNMRFHLLLDVLKCKSIGRVCTLCVCMHKMQCALVGWDNGGKVVCVIMCLVCVYVHVHVHTTHTCMLKLDSQPPSWS